MPIFKKMRAHAGLLGLLVLVVVTGAAKPVVRAEPDKETIVYSSIQPSNWDL